MAKKKVLVKPLTPWQKKNKAKSQKVKVATSNYFIEPSVDNSDAMADAIIEDIGGQEIMNLTRTDLLNGQSVTYNIIENLESTQRQFNPNEILKLQSTDADLFASYQLDLNTFTPEYGTGPSGDIVYVDSNTGELVINTVNIDNDLFLEVEIVSYSDISSTDV
jgi:hypothetical protein